MTVSEFADQTVPEGDSRYREGMGHLQAGEWQQAIDCFQALHRDYPADREVAEVLEEARFKAALDTETRVKGRRWAIPWRSIITGTLIIVATIAIGVFVTTVVTRQILPSMAETRVERERAQLLSEGQALLEAGELDEAQSRFAALLDQVPGHPEALQGLEEIAERRLIDDIYQQAVTFQAEGNYAEAQKLYVEILQQVPGYRDVPDRLAEVERRLEIDDLFAQAEAAYQAGQSRQALSLYERVRERNLSYERDLVEERLFELYMDVGRQIVSAPQEDELQRALSHFARALSLRPASPQAAREHRLAIACSEGFSAFNNEAWGTAIARLRAVFDERPDYLGGTAAHRLYLAYVYLGEQYEAAGNRQLAWEQYQKALELPVDRALAEERASALAPLLTPTVTPTRLPTTTPAPPWTGGQVQERNLLDNASFEGDWYDIYTGQVPEGWRVLWLDGVEFPGSADVALAPETIIGQKQRTPPAEQGLLFLDGSQHFKLFKSFAPMYVAAVQDVSGLDVGRRYRLVANIFVDTYIWDGKKVEPGGESARVRLGAGPQGAAWRDEETITYSDWWDGNNTSDFFLQYSEFTFDFEATQADMTIYIELSAIYGLNNNGFFIDDTALHPLGTRTD
ncbi:MAG: tetratricopeptide repeat protein [Chloroflexota bacterium]